MSENKVRIPCQALAVVDIPGGVPGLVPVDLHEVLHGVAAENAEVPDTPPPPKKRRKKKKETSISILFYRSFETGLREGTINARVSYKYYCLYVVLL